MANSDNRLSEVIKRRITGILLAVLFVLLWFFQGWPLRIGLVIAMGLAIYEMYAAFAHAGARPARWVGLVYTLAALPLYLRYGAESFAPLLAVCVMLGLVSVIVRGQLDFDALVATIMPLIYPGLLILMMFPLQDITPPLYASVALGLCFLLAIANDLTAYEVGRRFGKTKLCPAISPKKTVEGAIAGVIGSIAIALIIPIAADLITRYLPFAAPYHASLPALWHFVVMGVLGGIAAPVGDLTASVVKRHCGIKDYGSIFPGHGGLLDRLDSIVFTGALVYAYFALVLRVPFGA